jgi:hypothetical protein
MSGPAGTGTGTGPWGGHGVVADERPFGPG